MSVFCDSASVSLNTPIYTDTIVPSCSMLVSWVPKTIDFPYGMPMSTSKSQVGPTASIAGTREHHEQHRFTMHAIKNYLRIVQMMILINAILLNLLGLLLQKLSWFLVS